VLPQADNIVASESQKNTGMTALTHSEEGKSAKKKKAVYEKSIA
jgi:hypothetical protein